MLSCPTSVLLAHPLTLQYPSSINCSIIPSNLMSVFLLSLMTPPLDLMAPVHQAITHHVHRHLQSIISFPPINCHIFLYIDNHSIFSFQSLNWTKSSKDKPINGVTKGSAYSAAKGLTVLTRQSVIPLSKTKCNKIDAARRRNFLFPPREFFQTKRRPPHPWCVDGVDTPGWGLVQPQAERLKLHATLPGFSFSCVMCCVAGCEL